MSDDFVLSTIWTLPWSSSPLQWSPGDRLCWESEQQLFFTWQGCWYLQRMLGKCSLVKNSILEVGIISYSYIWSPGASLSHNWEVRKSPVCTKTIEYILYKNTKRWRKIWNMTKQTVPKRDNSASVCWKMWSQKEGEICPGRDAG